MAVKESCLLIGSSLFRIGIASEIAAWETNKDRPEEAMHFIYSAVTDITQALAADYVTKEEAEDMRIPIREYHKAADENNKEAALEALAILTLKAYDVTFNKVVECEQRVGEHS